MIKKIQLLFAFALALPAASYGWIGGPWDNGDYNQILDDSGIYQANLTFSNGQGFAQFGSNVGANSFLIPTTTAPLPPTSTGTYLNRSVIYYKGLTYFGSCMGTSDLVNKIITGITNGSSDVTSTSTTTATGVVSIGTDVISNGRRNSTCNTSWTAKVTSTKPVLKFKGKGQLTVLEPSNTAAVSAAITSILGNADDAVIPPVAPTVALAGVPGSVDVPFLTAVIAAAQQVQAAYPLDYNADTVPLNVYGIRKFFSTALIAPSNRR